MLAQALELNSRLLARVLDSGQTLIIAVVAVERELLALAGCWRLYLRSPQGALARIGYERIRAAQRRLEARSCCTLEAARQRAVFADEAPLLGHWLHRAEAQQQKLGELPLTWVELAQIVRADSRALGELRHQLIAARSDYLVERNLARETAKAGRRMRAALAPEASPGNRLRARRRVGMLAAQKELFREQLSHEAARALWVDQRSVQLLDRLVGLEALEQGVANVRVRGFALLAEQRAVQRLLQRQRRLCDESLRSLLQDEPEMAGESRSGSAD